MLKQAIHIDYREKVTERFITCMRDIIATRKKDCKTVTQFAAMIGEHQQNISKMERGERYPTIDHICRLCEIFDISPGWLLFGKDVQVSDTTIEKRLLKIEQDIKKLTAKK